MDPEARGNALLAAELVRDGIAAAKAGRKEEARDLLVRAVALNERDPQAWLWLSGVVEGLEDREVCLENVLTLDPQHEAARQGLEFVRRQMQAEGGRRAATIEETVAAAPVLFGKGTDTPIDMPATSPDASDVIPPSQEDDLSSVGLPGDDHWDNEWLCPYCAAETGPEDRHCPSCRQSLRIKVRRREKTSGWLRFAIILQAFHTVGALAGPLVLWALATEAARFLSASPMMAPNMGLDPVVAGVLNTLATGRIPPLVLVAASIPFLISLLVLIGLMQRWKFIYYLMLIGGILSLVSSVAGVVLMGGDGLLWGLFGVAYALVVVFIVFQMEDDFLTDERRVTTRIDPSAKNGMDFLKVGQYYLRERMFGLAVIHLRRAAGRMPEMIDTHLALAAAYLNLRRFDSATRALGDAKRVNPDHPALRDLQKAWDELAGAEA